MHLLFLGLGERRGGCELSSPGRQTHRSLCTGSLHPTPAHSQTSCYIGGEEGEEEGEEGEGEEEGEEENVLLTRDNKQWSLPQVQYLQL